jgi:hypothetical protein
MRNRFSYTVSNGFSYSFSCTFLGVNVAVQCWAGVMGGVGGGGILAIWPPMGVKLVPGGGPGRPGGKKMGAVL